MTRRVPVFFYGLYMDVDLLRSKGARPENVRRASVDGFALRIGQRATLVPDRSSVAHGLTMDLTHEELDRLYAEPSVAAYRREPVMSRSVDGAIEPALCYNLVVPPGAGEADANYARRLLELGRRLQLPPEWLQQITALGTTETT